MTLRIPSVYTTFLSSYGFWLLSKHTYLVSNLVRVTFAALWELNRFQTAKVTFKIIQGHCWWCYSMGYIWFSMCFILTMSILCCFRDIISQLRTFKEITSLTWGVCSSSSRIENLQPQAKAHRLLVLITIKLCTKILNYQASLVPGYMTRDPKI